MPLPDLLTYQDPEVLTPPEPCRCGRLTCDWCGDEAYAAPAHDYSGEDW